MLSRLLGRLITDWGGITDGEAWDRWLIKKVVRVRRKIFQLGLEYLGSKKRSIETIIHLVFTKLQQIWKDLQESEGKQLELYIKLRWVAEEVYSIFHNLPYLIQSSLIWKIAKAKRF